MKAITVDAYHFTRLVDYLERLGLASEPVLTKAGLDAGSLRTLGPDQALPAQQYSRLYKAAADALQTLGRSIPWGAGIGSEAFALKCHALISARTLGEALQLAQRFDALLYPQQPYRISLHEESGDSVALTYDIDLDAVNGGLMLDQWDREAYLEPVVLGSGLRVWHALCGWLTGRPLEAGAARIAAPWRGMDYSRRLEAVLHCPVQFDARDTALVFHREQLNRGIVQTGASLLDFLANAIYQLIAIDQQTATTSAAIKSLIASELPGPLPSLGRVAEQLLMSESSVRRRLQREGTSYQNLKDELRCQLAIEKLVSEGETVASIADFLGFTEASSFVRSFKSWTGMSPSAYRNEYQSPAASGKPL